MKSKTTWKMLACLGALGLLATGCPGDEPPGQTDAGQTTGDADGGNDEVGADAGADTGDDTGDGGQTCEPLVECPVDTCGMLDDGCEGMLDCGTCACTDGAPTTTDSCGVCGWGTVRCNPGETGAGSCSLGDEFDLFVSAAAPFPDCDTNVVYLDLAAAQAGDGSAASPFNDFTTAYAAATALAGAPAALVVTAGSITISGALTLSDGVSILGGFTRTEAGTWVYDTTGQARTEITVTPDPALAYTQGIYASGIGNFTLVSHLDVVVADAPNGEDVSGTQGGSSYGLRAIESDGLTIMYSDIFAGKGGTGAAGAPGQSGADGRDGADGIKGTNRKTASNPLFPGFASGATTPGCDTTYGVPTGGDGGRGGGACNSTTNPCQFFDSNWTAVFPPTDGETINVSGGRASDGSASRYTPAMRGDAQDGGDAIQSVLATDHGAAGAPGGLVVIDLWSSSGVGADGEHGANGSGGGGGGGVRYLHTSDNEWYWGPGGAGGGSGGCGGGPGAGGSPGGASIGALLVRSSVTILESEIRGDLGGAGGDGGQGGAPGQGGQGGSGTPLLEVWSGFGEGNIQQPDVDSYASSGDGGDGAPGVVGGHGGGGAGGNSYGIVCHDGSNPTIESSVVQAGGTAVGGGAPPQGFQGLKGEALDSFGCP